VLLGGTSKQVGESGEGKSGKYVTSGKVPAAPSSHGGALGSGLHLRVCSTMGTGIEFLDDRPLVRSLGDLQILRNVWNRTSEVPVVLGQSFKTV
jgi:hypothetical protein